MLRGMLQEQYLVFQIIQPQISLKEIINISSGQEPEEANRLQNKVETDLLAYDSSTGAITYVGPSAAETRMNDKAGTGVGITDGQVSIGQSVGTSDNVTFNDLTVSGSLSINGTTTNIDTTNLVVEDHLIKLSKENSADCRYWILWFVWVVSNIQWSFQRCE